MRLKHRSRTIPGKRALFAILALVATSGCGFKPLYSTVEGDGATSVSNMVLANVVGRDALINAVESAYTERAIAPDSEKTYELYLNVTERAQPLAVQIDATVTRFTYEMVARYQAFDINNGQSVSGRVRSEISFNIVLSQYSTLVAETAAREKAAEQLIFKIERDALARFSRLRQPKTERDDAIVTDQGAPTRARVLSSIRDDSISLIEEPVDDVWGEYSRRSKFRTSEGRDFEPLSAPIAPLDDALSEPDETIE